MTTQNCAECDTRVEPGQSFCGACDAVLSWDAAEARNGPAPASGTVVTAGSAAGSAAARPAPGWDAFSRPEGTGLARTARDAQDMGPGRVSSGADMRPDAGPTGPEAAPVAGLPTAPSGLPQRHTPADPPPHHTATSAPPAATGGAAGTPDLPDTHRIQMPAAPGSPAPSDAVSDRARPLLVPVSDPEHAPLPPAPAVAPVLPGRPDTARPHVRVPGPQQQAGHGPPCAWCATPNHPDRHFCVRCAMPTAERGDRTPALRPWWRRLLGPDRHETPWAGDRPRLRRMFDSIGTWVTLAIVLTLLVFAAVNLSDGIQATQDHFSKRAPVEPDTIRASRSYAGHGPKLVFDKLSNTWWGPGIAQSGQGEWIEVGFARPTRLVDVIITPGVSARADQLTKSALPHRVKATVTKKDGTTATRELTLDPATGAQRRSFRVGEVTRVRFTIDSAHAASARKQVAIAEIELFGRSDSSRT